MDPVAIVILNYNSYYETEKCVDSILNNKLDVTGIIIVDNASDNESFPYLKRQYKENSTIKVVKAKRNIGFAKGNNLGIRLAKKLWNAKFVLLLNSDTVILETDYLTKIMKEYKLGVAIMQTNVLRLNGRYTNRNYGTYGLLGMLSEAVQGFCTYYNIYFPKWLRVNSNNRLGPWISGCDLFLTPEYFELFNGLYPLTFLYGEEHILAILLRKACLEWKLVESAHLLHAKSRSTPLDFKLGTQNKCRMDLIACWHKILARILPLTILRWIINRGRW